MACAAAAFACARAPDSGAEVCCRRDADDYRRCAGRGRASTKRRSEASTRPRQALDEAPPRRDEKRRGAWCGDGIGISGCSVRCSIFYSLLVSLPSRCSCHSAHPLPPVAHSVSDLLPVYCCCQPLRARASATAILRQRACTLSDCTSLTQSLFSDAGASLFRVSLRARASPCRTGAQAYLHNHFWRTLLPLSRLAPLPPFFLSAAFQGRLSASVWPCPRALESESPPAGPWNFTCI